jgi:hypothetical protein
MYVFGANLYSLPTFSKIILIAYHVYTYVFLCIHMCIYYMIERVKENQTQTKE